MIKNVFSWSNPASRYWGKLCLQGFYADNLLNSCTCFYLSTATYSWVHSPCKTHVFSLLFTLCLCIYFPYLPLISIFFFLYIFNSLNNFFSPIFFIIQLFYFRFSFSLFILHTYDLFSSSNLPAQSPYNFKSLYSKFII